MADAVFEMERDGVRLSQVPTFPPSQQRSDPHDPWAMAAADANVTPPASPHAQVEGTATPRDGLTPTMPAGHGVEGAEGGPDWATYVSQVVASQLQAHTANITAQVQNAVATTMQHAQGTIISQLQAHFAPTMQR
eukprot:3248278-Pyramimonas_sp.AAC.1